MWLVIGYRCGDSYISVSGQWSFGVTMWEIFTCGSVPYAGIQVMKLASELRAGERLEKPDSAACCDDMFVLCSDLCVTL